MKKSALFMKTVTTLLIFIFAIGIETQAQKIYFSDTSNKWTVFEIDAISGPGTYQGDNLYSNNSVVNNGGNTWTVIKKEYSVFWSFMMLDSALVRDDLSANKVYAIVYPDTNEVVLYDYSLNVGDTFKMNNSYGSFNHIVTQIDSTLINSTNHKIFKMTGSNPGEDYWIVEGIGSTASPLHPSLPVLPILSQHSWFLSCFSNSSIQSQLSANPTNFINTSTGCTLGINELVNKHSKIIVAPQPSFSYAIIRLPYLFKQGNLSITNTLGQKVYHLHFNHKDELIIPHPGTQGIYMYHISDNSLSKSFSGKIVFE